MEVFDDARQNGSEIPVVIAGDFNLDLSQEPAASVIASTEFNNPFNDGSFRPTTTRSRMVRARTIDWILIRGPLASVGTELHDSVVASDHYPMSLTLVP
jgi:endonuclease/exonuclease/phosphatase family metal-dependent hydrolase